VNIDQPDHPPLMQPIVLVATIFAQLMAHVSQSTFQRCVARYSGEYKASCFSCWDQYFYMAFAQLTYRESLRDIEAWSIPTIVVGREPVPKACIRCSLTRRARGVAPRG